MTADFEKPSYSYASLIGQAIHQCKDRRARLSTIYEWISANYPYFRPKGGWQNSIRHNLTVNKCFIKDMRPNDPPGKGSFWKINPEYQAYFEDGILKQSVRIPELDENISVCDESPPETNQFQRSEETATSLVQVIRSGHKTKATTIRPRRSRRNITASADMSDETEHQYPFIVHNELETYISSDDELPYWAQQTLRHLIRSPKTSSRQFFSVFRPVDNDYFTPNTIASGVYDKPSDSSFNENFNYSNQ